MPNMLIVTITFASLGIALWGWLRFRARNNLRVNWQDTFNPMTDVSEKVLTIRMARSVKQVVARSLESEDLIRFFEEYTSHPDMNGLSGAEREKFRQDIATKSLQDLAKTIKMLRRIRTRHQPIGATASKFWDHLGFIFSRKMRDQIYDPIIEELKEDLLLARARRRTPAARRWIQVSFFVRTSVVFLHCLLIAASRPFGKLIPAAIKAWWKFLL